MIKGISVFKKFYLGRYIRFGIWSEITFYDDTWAEPLNVIFDSVFDDISRMTYKCTSQNEHVEYGPTKHDSILRIYCRKFLT